MSSSKQLHATAGEISSTKAEQQESEGEDPYLAFFVHEVTFRSRDQDE